MITNRGEILIKRRNCVVFSTTRNKTKKESVRFRGHYIAGDRIKIYLAAL